MTAIADIEAAWKTGEHVGEAKPTQIVEVRLGDFHRAYSSWPTHDVHAAIYGESPQAPWQATWTPRSDWRDLPAVATCDVEQDFDSQGIAVATISLTNELMTPVAGALGTYHLLERGALSPFRGSPFDLGAYAEDRYDPVPNEWYDYLTKNAQVRVWQGYGAAIVPTFVGMVDDVDLESHPDHISITARDFGQVLVDEHVFGWVKSPHLPEPTTFYTTANGKDDKGVGHGAEASSSRDGHPARFVIDDSGRTEWISQDHDDGAVTEWVEIRLPKGRYDSFAIHNAYPDMEVYVGVYAHSKGLPTGVSCTVDGDPVADGWVFVGNGDVPGTNGGWPWLRHWPTMSDKGNAHKLNHSLELGDDSILRVGLRSLYHVGNGIHRAGVVRLAGIKRKPVFTAGTGRARKRIECDDVADIVKVCLRWAGFKEWDVTDVGTGLTKKWTFSKADTLMDVIQKCCEATGFTFYMKPPDPTKPATWETSLGIPTFAPNLALKNQANIPVVRDGDLLTGLQAKATDEPLSSIIRIRGKELKAKQGGEILGSDRTRRAMAAYRPPWAVNKRLAGVIKHFVAGPTTNAAFKKFSEDECMVMAMLTALQMALMAYTGEFEIPGHPNINLNGQVAVLDEGSGVSTRVYVARRTSSFAGGEQAKFTTTVGGALIDVTDVRLVIRDLQDQLRSMGRATDRVTIGDALFIEVD